MSRRYRKSDAEKAAEGLFAFLTSVPFWVGPMVAVLGFLLLRFVFPAFLYVPKQPGEVLAGMSRVLAPIFGGGCLAIWVAAEFKKFLVRRRFDGSSDADSLRALDWREFETLIGEAFRRQGYTVAATPAGADGGVDLILTRDGERTLVQCKHWKNWRVGVETIRALHGVVAADGAVGGIVVSSGQYTPAARKFAETIPIRLIDGPALQRMMAEIRNADPVEAAVARQDASPDEPPPCPKCQSPMVLRTARQGPNAGSRFYGCSRFPACRTTRPLASGT